MPCASLGQYVHEQSSDCFVLVEAKRMILAMDDRQNFVTLANFLAASMETGGPNYQVALEVASFESNFSTFEYSLVWR